jgi:hypothetical protein
MEWSGSYARLRHFMSDATLQDRKALNQRIADIVAFSTLNTT